MFTLYFDDSGTDAQSEVAVAGAYVATVEQWAEFKRNWEEVNEREKFGIFHMADFVARREQFTLPEWKDEPKRKRTVKALISTIKIRVRFGVAAAVQKSAYDEIVPDDLRMRFGKNHYTFAIRQCMGVIDKWRQKYGHADRIRYVFDQLPKGGRIADINSLFETLASGGEHAMNHYGVYPNGWSFEDKRNVVQLQAADMWAYENFRYMRDQHIPDSKEKPRESYLALLECPVTLRYQNRRTLTELVQDMRKGDAKEVDLGRTTMAEM
jgi:hypothetical protein